MPWASVSPWAATVEHVRRERRDLGGRCAGGPADQRVEVVAPGGGEHPLAEGGARAPAVGGAAHGAERRPADRVAAAFVAHLPAIPADPVPLSGPVPPHRDAAGAGAHHDARPVGERRRERDLDVGGHHDRRGEVLACGAPSAARPAPARARRRRRRRPARRRVSRPAPASAWRTTSAMTLGGGERPAGPHGRPGAFGPRERSSRRRDTPTAVLVPPTSAPIRIASSPFAHRLKMGWSRRGPGR